MATKDLRSVLDVVYTLGDDHSGGGMLSQALARLGELVGCETVSYNRVDHTTGRLLSSTAEPADLNITELPGFNAVFDQHPGFAAYRCGRLMPGRSAAMTDFADLPTLRRLALYTDYYQSRGANDQLFCVVQPGNQQGTALAFNRTRRGFSHRDRVVVELATPHLAQAAVRRQRLAALTAAVRSLGRHTEQVEQALPLLSTLTARERDVVELLVGGVGDREIACSLAISQRTVHKHLERIYRKLGLGNRTSLIAATHRADGTNLRAVGR
ncbi:MAG: response regulator transcription factor [Pseudonocardiaceae bacterium]